MHFVLDFDHTIYDTGSLWDFWVELLGSVQIDKKTANEKGEEIFGSVFTLQKHLELLKIEEDVAKRLVDSFRELTLQKSPELIYKDAIPFVNSNKDLHSFSILTFGDFSYQHEKIEACGISSYIDNILIAGPEKFKIEHLKNLILESGSSIVFVDDNPRELTAVSDSGLPITLYRMIRPNSRHGEEKNPGDGVDWKCISAFDEIEVN